MNNESMANFISEQRKAKNLTQKQLAEMLQITDKAVSKWERGLGYPDITILTKLAEILGVTTTELLNGVKEDSPVLKADVIVESTLNYAEKITVNKHRKAVNITMFILTLLCFTAIFVCVVCDLAISHGITWSMYTITSVTFGWLVIIPLLYFKTNKILMSLISLSVFIVPFLYCIEQTEGTYKWVAALAVPICAASLLLLWAIYFLYKKLRNKWFATGHMLILLLIDTMVINLICARYTSQTFFDFWDILSIAVILFVSIVLYLIGFLKNTNK